MNGILLVDKPSGWTSSDVVAKLRGILHERRIGHSGTLDPMATGLLVVYVGRATRAVEFAENHTKRYRAGLRLGLVTDTQDITGTRICGVPREVSADELQAILPRFTGKIEQLPPMYSAIKIGGKKLYEIARRGGEVERKARSVTILDLSLSGRDGEDYLLDVCCSKGTYIRTLCHDIGAALGCGGCMSALRRKAVGMFSLTDAKTREDIQRAAEEGCAEKLLMPVDSQFLQYPSLALSDAEELRVRCGNPIPYDAESGTYRVYSGSGEFLAIASAGQGELRVIKSFFEV